jgi:hypothetical protein
MYTKLNINAANLPKASAIPKQTKTSAVGGGLNGLSLEKLFFQFIYIHLWYQYFITFFCYNILWQFKSSLLLYVFR